MKVTKDELKELLLKFYEEMNEFDEKYEGERVGLLNARDYNNFLKTWVEINFKREE